MYKKFVQLSAMAAAAQAADNSASDHWAVIVVGSGGYMNYRHHADGCHAYQQAKANGIPEDQIIMLAIDNVAQSSSNPYPGKLFNKPTPKGTPGVDVYKGCNIDYKGNDANKDNLLKALKGDTSVKKALKSNANSKIFFSYFDHGAPGLVGMPVGKYLYADELMSAFKFMHENKMYKELVMYMEACESGSMFENLPKDINVYALSAANGHESSWGTYCSPNDMVDGKSIRSCLGDLFSVNWMEDLDKAMKDKQMGIETLITQYNTVKTKTNKSHVLQWGDLTIDKEVIGQFEAATFAEPKDTWAALKSIGKRFVKEQVGWDDYQTAQKNDFAVDVRDINMHYLYTKVAEDPSEENQKALMEELNNRLATDKRFEQLFPQFFEQVKDKKWPELATEDFDCYRNLIDLYTESCGEADTYAMKYFGNFIHQCQAIKYYQGALNDFKTKLANTCQSSA